MNPKITSEFVKTVMMWEIVDIFLFIFGLVVPRADYPESVIAFFIDCYLLVAFRQRKVKGSAIIMLFESIGFLDWIFMGKMDVFGWIGVVPLWYIILIDQQHRDQREIQNVVQQPPLIAIKPTLIIQSNSIMENEPVTKPKGKNTRKIQCESCGSSITKKMAYCEYCGQKIDN